MIIAFGRLAKFQKVSELTYILSVMRQGRLAVRSCNVSWVLEGFEASLSLMACSFERSRLRYETTISSNLRLASGKTMYHSEYIQISRNCRKVWLDAEMGEVKC